MGTKLLLCADSMTALGAAAAKAETAPALRFGADNSRVGQLNDLKRREGMITLKATVAENLVAVGLTTPPLRNSFVRRLRTALAATTLASAVAVASSQAVANNLIVNGSFEDPVNAVGNFWQNYGTPNPDPHYSGSSIPGWTITVGNVDIQSDLYTPVPAPAYQGNQYLDLIGNDYTGGISQTFSTVPGTTYTLSYAYASVWTGSSAAALVSLIGNGTLFSTTIAHSGGTDTNLDWIVSTTPFVANSTTTTLSFTSIVVTPPNQFQGIYLDGVGVNVSTTPLPSSWTMMLIGLTGLGFLSYRQRCHDPLHRPSLPLGLA